MVFIVMGRWKKLTNIFNVRNVDTEYIRKGERKKMKDISKKEYNDFCRDMAFAIRMPYSVYDVKEQELWHKRYKRNPKKTWKELSKIAKIENKKIADAFKTVLEKKKDEKWLMN